VLPANHPILRSRVVVGVDPAAAAADIARARKATGGKAAARWPENDLDVRLMLERFDPLQVRAPPTPPRRCPPFRVCACVYLWVGGGVCMGERENVCVCVCV